jgi:hypothetical protein
MTTGAGRFHRRIVVEDAGAIGDDHGHAAIVCLGKRMASSSRVANGA